MVTREYPEVWRTGAEAYYPLNDVANMRIFKQYRDLAAAEPRTIFGGRLAEYRYYDMHQVIGSAMAAFQLFKRPT